jgi:hypothetical protein
LMRCPPQPARARTIESKHADVIKVLKMFNRVTPCPDGQHPSLQSSGSIGKNGQSGEGAYASDIHIDA